MENRIINLIKKIENCINDMESITWHSGAYSKDTSGMLPILLTKGAAFIQSAYGEKSIFYKNLIPMISAKTLTLVGNGAPEVYSFTSAKSAAKYITNLLADIDEGEMVSPSQVAKIGQKDIKMSDKVFVVHGRNTNDLDEIELFIKELGYIPVVLYKDIEPGMTIIEKLEKHTDAFAAVVLLSPDDLGKLNKGGETEKSRARQNVVFEYGFFMGVLGRNNILVVDYGVNEKPSDFHGVALTNHNNNIENVKAEINKGLTKIRNRVS